MISLLFCCTSLTDARPRRSSLYREEEYCEKINIWERQRREIILYRYIEGKMRRLDKRVKKDHEWEIKTRRKERKGEGVDDKWGREGEREGTHKVNSLRWHTSNRTALLLETVRTQLPPTWSILRPGRGHAPRTLTPDVKWNVAVHKG